MIRVISSTNISTQNKKYKENQKFINYHNLTFQGISVKSAEEYKDDDTLVGKYLKQAIASMKETFSKGEEVKPQTVEEIRNQFENKRVTIKKKIFVILKRKKIKNLTKQEVEKIEKFLEEKQKKLEMQEVNLKVTEQKLYDIKSTIISTERAQNINRMNNNLKAEDIKIAYEELKGFNRIAGYQHTKDIFEKYFVDEIAKEKIGLKSNVIGSVLFFGPTGNGKTLFTKSFAEQTGCKNKKLEVSHNLPTEKRGLAFIDKLYKFAKQSEALYKSENKRTIIFIDEVDKFINKEYENKKIGDETYKKVVCDKFEEFIQTCSQEYHCSVFAATNNAQNLAIDLTEKNNFRITISIDPPDKDNIENVFKHYLKNRVNSKMDYSLLAEKVINIENGAFSNSQIKDICELTYAIHKEDTTQEDVLKFINENIDPKITSEDLKQHNEDKELFLIEEL